VQRRAEDLHAECEGEIDVKTNRRWLATGLLVVAALLLAACGSTSSGTSPSATATGNGGGGSGSGSGIKTASTGIGTVLTNSKGLTMYWFAPDTATKSNCNGSCASFWPPVPGPVSAASGVSLPGAFGTITRADGSVQATYKGHPLYTFMGDTGPGQTSGNGKVLSGGLWTAMTPSAGKPGGAASPSSSSSSSSSGGGYGY
jgi:predicted lipoprotein with Yx(FWY)xxD motif